VANLGPGFDWLGCAVDGVGDTVTAIPLPGKAGVVEISSIIGDGGRLPLDGSTNCCGVAAAHTLRLLGNPDVGVSLSIDKVRKRRRRRRRGRRRRRRRRGRQDATLS